MKAHDYIKKNLTGDLAAGVTTAVLLIPQAMAYAMLASLPPQIGLYASTVPLALYALTGSSRFLAIGPVAIISLLVASTLAELKAPPESATGIAVLLALISGTTLTLLGIIRGGIVDNFLSHTVIKGFTGGAAITIALTQMGSLSGMPGVHGGTGLELIYYTFTQINHMHLPTLATGCGSLAALIILRRISPEIPNALIVLALATALTYYLRLDSGGIAIVGTVPSGFPAPQIPPIDISLMSSLIVPALIIALLGYVESISIARTLATRNREAVDSNRELIAIGLANMAGSFFQGCPVAGGFSRTAVNYQAGAKTRNASLFTALIVSCAILFLTPYLYYIPKASLSAVIIAAVLPLIDVKGAERLFKVQRKDGHVLVATFLLTLIWGVEQGILAGILASLGLFIWRSVTPHCAVLGRLEGHQEVYRNVERYDVTTWPHVVILRIDSSLYFANANFFEHRVMELMSHNEEARAIIIDGSGINDIDAPAEETLRNISDNLKARDCRLYFASLKGPVRDLLEKSGFVKLLGTECFFMTITEALHHIESLRNNTPSPLQAHGTNT